jgi:hypothetical protein
MWFVRLLYGVKAELSGFIRFKIDSDPNLVSEGDFFCDFQFALSLIIFIRMGGLDKSWFALSPIMNKVYYLHD